MNCNLTTKLIYKKEITQEVIKQALIKTNKTILNSFNIKKSDASIEFNSKSIRNFDAKLAIIFNTILKDLLKIDSLNKDFLEESLNLNTLSIKSEDFNDSSRKLHLKYQFSFQYNNIYALYYSQAFSLLLLVLHFQKIIILPFCFRIPINSILADGANKRKREDLGFSSYPLMFKQVRQLDSQNEHDDESKFITSGNKSILISYGSKLMLALGWVDFKDVNIEELMYFRKNAIDHLGFKNNYPPYALLISFLYNKNPDTFPIDSNTWQKNIIEETKKINSEKLAIQLINKKNKFDLNHYLNQQNNDKPWEGISINLFSLKNIKKYTSYLPEYKKSIDNWIMIEESFISKTKLESYKGIEKAFSYLNMYLFFILPFWFKHNSSKLQYPKDPKDLKVGSFISTILKTNELKPITLLDFINDIQEQKEIKNETIYALLKNLEKFFDFIEIYSSELPGCAGFIQPISALDYPKITRSNGTNKGLIPRYLFPILVNYIELISKYNEVIGEKLLSEEINKQWLENNIKNNCIDTFGLQDKVGFIPVTYINRKLVVLKEIPDLLDIKSTPLKDERILNIHYPHILNHILVVLQTGLRNNHIQWLDAEKFDSLAKEDENSFSSLYVNTDKSKNSAWTPVVHKRVISILREQLNWRNKIKSISFNEKKFYNNNSKTKWGKFYPLFSYMSDGLPYGDNNYLKVWIKILPYFQTFIKNNDIKFIELVSLLPPRIKFNDFNLDLKLKEYGNKCEDICDLRWTSDITPHSARVSIVSNYITVLPAEIIGQYITGQTEAVVHHYVKLDPDYLTQLEKGQKDRLAQLAIQKEFDQLTGLEKQHPIFADKDDSNIAQSIAINKVETISSYGCISLSIKEECKNGIDILLENSNIKLAFNKTEICPYNNNCPADLIKELKGFRRCGVCPYAVRSIDHLPAIAIKKRQVMELLEEIESKLLEANTTDSKYTLEELDAIEEERQKITEELLGWIVSEEMLEANRKRLKEDSNQAYIVKKPEILIKNLQQVTTKENDIEYLLTRLHDCESFPNLDSPIIRAKFDLLRRQLLARLGDFKNAFDIKLPQNPAYECVGLIKEVINRYGLNKEKVVELLSTNMLSLPHKNEPLLGLNYEK